MIVFDMKCAQGHRFEGWFDSAEDLDNQLKKGLVTCPVCGDASVEKAPSSFAIAKASRKDSIPDAASAAKLIAKAMERHIKENFDDVGPMFAKEALKIHYGASEPRNIRGVSTPEEEKVLKEEGVEFFKVGTAQAPVSREDDDNSE